MSKEDELKNQFSEILPRATRFAVEMQREINQLLEDKVDLAFPVTYRIKSWESIESKIDRLSMNLKTIEALWDLVGLRLIFLFKREVKEVCKILDDNFDVIQNVNTEDRLSDKEFGYLSMHYIVKPPKEWYKIPIFYGLEDMMAEVQVRTFSQHIWAEISHRLQYKTEASVPLPVRRSINRVSAVLEIVDLEYERVLVDRGAYFDAIDPAEADQELNSDLISKILDNSFPKNNKIKNERYSDLLLDLDEFNIVTSTTLLNLIEKHHDTVMKNEKSFVLHAQENEDFTGTTKARTEKGVFFSHVGLMRGVLEKELGKKWLDYNKRRSDKPQVR